MAEEIITEEIYTEKSSEKELIYFNCMICEILSEIEDSLMSCFKYDRKINLLILLKNKWIEKFNLL